MPRKLPENTSPEGASGPSPAEAGALAEDLFPAVEQPLARVCTYNRCRSGHTWAPTLRLTQCPGCQGQILAAKMENCPQCNEPVVEMHLRHDHMAQGMQIMPLCKGAATLADCSEIIMSRDHAEREEQTHTPRVMEQKVEKDVRADESGF